MGLSDTVKDLQRKAESKELQLLKDARKYMNENTEEKIDARGRKLLAFENSAQGQTTEGRKWMVREIAEINRILDRRKLYGELLRLATRAERKQKGGGEAFVQRNRELIERKLAVIDETFQRTRNYQMELDDLKESEKVGDFI